MIWARTAGSPAFCAVASVSETTALAYCRSTFPTYDTVEVDERPEHGQRCDGCVRVLVDRRCIERGLTELLAAGEVR